MGKGVTVKCSLQRPLAPDKVGPELDEPTFLQAISIKAGTAKAHRFPESEICVRTCLTASVSLTEEPGAGKPLAGICAGDVG